MLSSRKEHWDQGLTPELTIHKPPQSTAAPVTEARLYESKLVLEPNTASQFPFRILVVDDEPSIRETAEQILQSAGYEVHTAVDGVDGLRALGHSLPDLIISDLNMPRMSGLEFLAVIRERFPHIATIAMSGEYCENPTKILADAFLQKGHYTLKELFHEIVDLLDASPIRPARRKGASDAPFVPRDDLGYVVIGCTKCLRPNKLEAMGLNGGIHQTTCQTCDALLRFEIDHEVEPLVERQDA